MKKSKQISFILIIITTTLTGQISQDVEYFATFYTNLPGFKCVVQETTTDKTSIKNLIKMLNSAPQIKEPITKIELDFLILEFEKLTKKPLSPTKPKTPVVKTPNTQEQSRKSFSQATAIALSLAKVILNNWDISQEDFNKFFLATPQDSRVLTYKAFIPIASQELSIPLDEIKKYFISQIMINALEQNISNLLMLTQLNEYTLNNIIDHLPKEEALSWKSIKSSLKALNIPIDYLDLTTEQKNYILEKIKMHPLESSTDQESP